MINTVAGYGSTGSICEDIANLLEQQGHECYIAYGQLSTSYHKSFKIGTRIENHLHNVGSRLIGKQGYFSKSGTKNLISYIENVKPDIIHLHNLHGNYLNLQILFEYFIKVQIPIVYTLHDCWAFTGKCAHFTDVQCYKWKTQCYSCPQLKKYPPSLFFDYSKDMYVDKKNWFTSIQKMNIIPVSNWLASEVEQSFLKKYPITPIYNWVNHSIFKETIDREVIKRYNIDENKFTIVLVSAIWDTKDVKWQDALKLATMIDKDIQILMIGNVSSPKLLPKNIKHIPYVNGKEELAKIYSISDVYIHLSTEDTFGKVIAEALSCGTPAIVYNSTACPEIIDNTSGYVVEKRNVKEVYEAVLKIKEKGRIFFSKNCRERVIKEFDLKTNIDLTIQVYKKLLKT
ncbi:glycosyltransferase [Empedobacter sp.]|uniref:glycosyltransferase n=1 Tax=Empedobacter sp. TaxID=1927715 RepID=UPI0028AB2417|nr:glycosyltransferase [Empedobacter sp.]